MVPEEIDMLVTSDPGQGAINRSSDGSVFNIQLQEPIEIERDALSVKIQVEEATIWWVVPNIITGENDTFYVFGDNDAAGTELFTVVIAQGLYDLAGINLALLSGLEALGAKTSPEPLVQFSEDAATQKVILRLNYTNTTVDFTQSDTPRLILGFDSAVIGPEAGAPLNILADNVAAFNQINNFLIHSDIIGRGLRFNNTYNNTIAQVLIDVPPGSQIVSTPFHPAKSNGQELAGAKRTNIRFWLTDDQNRPVDTNGEFWTARLSITYLRPFVLEK